MPRPDEPLPISVMLEGRGPSSTRAAPRARLPCCVTSCKVFSFLFLLLPLLSLLLAPYLPTGSATQLLACLQNHKCRRGGDTGETRSFPFSARESSSGRTMLRHEAIMSVVIDYQGRASLVMMISLTKACFREVRGGIEYKMKAISSYLPDIDFIRHQNRSIHCPIKPSSQIIATLQVTKTTNS
jgi:hypothetical protein